MAPMGATKMNIVRYVTVLFLITLLGQGQVPQTHDRVELSSKAEAPVHGLYRQLIAHPIGAIPTPKRMKVLSPYLSSSLIHRIDQARACNADYFRLHPKNDVKAPLAWMEFGLFSGATTDLVPVRFRSRKWNRKMMALFRLS